MTGFEIATLPLVARICLVVLFPFSALDKIVHWKAALGQAGSSFLPGGPLLLVGAIAVELVAPLCILARWHDRTAALVLALFCVVTALVYHRFWTIPGFWSPANEKGRAHFWDFLKNFGLVGGLLLVALS
ncbi:MAG: DoxX family protein [Burkholderiaceae bacterium]|nr:DoxX family protein [Burkholderiaceae bacterium]